MSTAAFTQHAGGVNTFLCRIYFCQYRKLLHHLLHRGTLNVDYCINITVHVGGIDSFFSWTLFCQYTLAWSLTLSATKMSTSLYMLEVTLFCAGHSSYTCTQNLCDLWHVLLERSRVKKQMWTFSNSGKQLFFSKPCIPMISPSVKVVFLTQFLESRFSNSPMPVYLWTDLIVSSWVS